jgi:hypothetical protein
VSFSIYETPPAVTLTLRSQGVPTPAPAGGVRVNLATTGPVGYPDVCIGAPSSVTIPAGQTGVPVQLRLGTGGFAFEPVCGGGVTATGADDPTIQGDHIGVNVWTWGAPPPRVVLTRFQEHVGAGLMTWVTITTQLPLGMPVTVTSSDPARLLVSPDQQTPGSASITIPWPYSNKYGPDQSVSFTVHGMEGQTGPVTVTASVTLPWGPDYYLFQPVQGSASVPVVPTRIVALPFDMPCAGEEFPFLASPDPGQPVRPGSALSIGLTSGTPAVGQFRFQGGLAASGTLTIPGGGDMTPSGPDQGGANWVALSPGTTTVSMTLPPGMVAAWYTPNGIEEAPSLLTTVLDCPPGVRAARAVPARPPVAQRVP